MLEQLEPASESDALVLPGDDEEIISLKDDIVALNRFLFLGSKNPFFETSGNKNVIFSVYCVKNLERNISEHLKSLASSNPSAIVGMIKKALESKSLKTKEYLIFVIAYVLRLSDFPELKKEVRMSLHQLIESPEDFLMFMFNYQSINNGKISFGQGMKKAVKTFYDNKSPSELLEIVFATETFQSIRHVDVLHLAHAEVENEDKIEIIKASRMKYEEIKTAADSSTTMKKILKYKDLKRCKETHELLSILKRKDYVYKLKHLPKNALKSAEVIELILPNLSLTELLSIMEKLCTNQMLRTQNPVSKKICNALQCSNKVINDAKLNPLYVFQILRTLERKMTLEISESDETKEKEKKFSNPFVIKKLRQIFDQTMQEQPKTGCRYFVTVDFRKFSDRQSKLAAMKNIHPSEVQAIVALTLLKNEKNVSVMSFTDDRNQLKPVEWTSETSFEKAMEIYENEIKTTPKTKEHVVLPMRKATLDKKKVDVFITFVSSIGRTMGGNAKPPFQQLDEYKNAMKMPKAKLVVVNFSRPRPDFKYDKNNIDETGILEIVGFSPESMKIIEAYAKNCFI